MSNESSFPSLRCSETCSDKESLFEQSVNVEHRHEKAADKAVPTSFAPHKVRGVKDASYPLRPIGHLGKRKVGNTHRMNLGLRAKLRAMKTHMSSQIES